MPLQPLKRILTAAAFAATALIGTSAHSGGQL